MSAPVESQFEDYCAALATALGHADRHGPAKLYMKGLLLPGDRKSVEPMAARLCPENQIARALANNIPRGVVLAG